MRGPLRWFKSWRKVAGGFLIVNGLLLWVTGAEAKTSLFSEGATLDVVFGGALAIGGIAVIGTSERDPDSWYDKG